MKKTLILIVAFILLFAGVYTIVDIVSSLWLVLKYESFNVYTSGALIGKCLFLACCIVAFWFFYKLFRHPR